MRAKQIPSSLTRSKSPILLVFFTISLLALSFLFFLSSPSDSTRSSPYPYLHPPIRPETSFIASLEHFLTHKAPNHHRTSDDTVRTVLEDDVRRLDERKLAKEMESYYPLNMPIRVYVYEMPTKFTYYLLCLFRNTYRDTSNLTSNGSPVHRLIEQHSIDYWLWADLIAPESERLLKNVVRVDMQDEADLFYVPFLTTISFFWLEKQRCTALYRVFINVDNLGKCTLWNVSFQREEALKWVTDQPAWKQSAGRDHIFPIHHPWSFKSVRRYVKNAIWLLPDMDSTGNWYKPGQVSLEKDLILPYVPNGGKIRTKLVTELTGFKDIIIEEVTAGEGGKAAAQKGMRWSVFCLCPAGDTPSSARLFDAIVSGCIPVIISDELEIPFEGILDYGKEFVTRNLIPIIFYSITSYFKMAIFVSSTDAVQPGWLLRFLKGISSAQIREMRKNLAEYSRHFVYASPAQPLGPQDLVWRMMTSKLVISSFILGDHNV
ncbi:hypothetical protein CRYUN_Cryun05aG0059700 [Craigia yunnanensis]